MKRLDSIFSFILSFAGILLSWKKKKKCPVCVAPPDSPGTCCSYCGGCRCFCNGCAPLGTQSVTGMK